MDRVPVDGSNRLDPSGTLRRRHRPRPDPGRTEPGGCIGTTAVGILGALLGGFLASALDIGEIDDFFDLGTWLIAIGGSVLLLLIIRAIAR